MTRHCVDLNAQECAYLDRHAVIRSDMIVRQGKVGTKVDDKRADPGGVRAKQRYNMATYTEGAFVKFCGGRKTGLLWHMGLDETHGPDDGDVWMGRFVIDVKAVSQHRLNLISHDGEIHPDWAYVLVCAEDHPRYWIAGWAWGRDLWACPLDYKKSQSGRPMHVMYKNDPRFRDVAELRAMGLASILADEPRRPDFRVYLPAKDVKVRAELESGQHRRHARQVQPMAV